jgi:hypothetical protein
MLIDLLKIAALILVVSWCLFGIYTEGWIRGYQKGMDSAQKISFPIIQKLVDELKNEAKK